MRAYQIEDYGAEPRLSDIRLPPCAPGQVQLRIAACALNFADLLMIEGRYQERPEPPVTLGMELAGRIEAVGAEVTEVSVGQAVAVYAGHGGLAEAGVFDAARCTPVPDGIDLQTAAALQIAHGTGHLALARRARLQPGETLLVLGAAGGVGLAAVEIGRLMGARVIAAARGADRLRVVESAGASHLIDTATQDIRDAVKALGGADVAYDPVGGDAFTAAFRSLNPEGRLLTIGFASGTVPPIKANHLLVKNIDVIGLNLAGYPHFNPAALRDSIAQVFDWVRAGKLSPHIGHRLPLDRAAEGLALLRGRQATGKIVVTP